MYSGNYSQNGCPELPFLRTSQAIILLNFISQLRLFVVEHAHGMMQIR